MENLGGPNGHWPGLLDSVGLSYALPKVAKRSGAVGLGARQEPIAETKVFVPALPASGHKRVTVGLEDDVLLKFVTVKKTATDLEPFVRKWGLLGIGYRQPDELPAWVHLLPLDGEKLQSAVQAGLPTDRAIEWARFDPGAESVEQWADVERAINMVWRVGRKLRHGEATTFEERSFLRGVAGTDPGFIIFEPPAHDLDAGVAHALEQAREQAREPFRRHNRAADKADEQRPTELVELAMSRLLGLSRLVPVFRWPKGERWASSSYEAGGLLDAVLAQLQVELSGLGLWRCSGCLTLDMSKRPDAQGRRVWCTDDDCQRKEEARKKATYRANQAAKAGR